MKKLLVAGGGIAGFNLIKKLLHHVNADSLHITLADPQQDFVFKPILYEQLNGRIVSINRKAFFEQHAKQLRHKPTKVSHCQFQMDGLINIHFEDMTQETFDFVVLAMGAQTNYFGVPGASEHCLPLLTQADMERFKLSLDRKLTHALKSHKPAHFHIIGGGLSGVELAFEMRAYFEGEALTRYGQLPPPEIIMIEAMPTILPGFATDEIHTVLTHLQRQHIQVLTSHQVKQVTETSLLVKHNEVERELESIEPLWVAGIKAHIPDSFFSENVASYPGNGRLKVTPQLSIPNHPNVFVVGDLAGSENPKTGRLIPTTGQLGEQQAAYVAKLLRRRIQSGHLVANYPAFVPAVRGHFVSLGPGQAAITLDMAPAPLSGKTLVGSLIASARQAYYGTKLKL